MIATQDIQAGEYLFVTPPTVHANQQTVKDIYTAGVGVIGTGTGAEKQSKGVEDVAMDVLVQNMMEAIERKEFATVNSFLALMGVKASNASEEDVSMDRLNGKDYDDDNDDTGTNKCWSEDDDDDLKNVTKDDLRNIILKNGTCYHHIPFEEWNINTVCTAHVVSMQSTLLNSSISYSISCTSQPLDQISSPTIKYSNNGKHPAPPTSHPTC